MSVGRLERCFIDQQIGVRIVKINSKATEMKAEQQLDTITKGRRKEEIPAIHIISLIQKQLQNVFFLFFRFYYVR